MTLLERHAPDIAFVLRCSASATLAYLIAQAAGLHFPAWAAMTAIIVSQEKLEQAWQVTLLNFFGTVTGVVISLSTGILAHVLGAGLTCELAVSVIIASIVARCYPSIKICIYTCPVVYLSVSNDTSLFDVGFFRGVEILLGGITGSVLNVVSNALLARRVKSAGV